jgi:hypothetical protein
MSPAPGAHTVSAAGAWPVAATRAHTVSVAGAWQIAPTPVTMSAAILFAQTRARIVRLGPAIPRAVPVTASPATLPVLGIATCAAATRVRPVWMGRQPLCTDPCQTCVDGTCQPLCTDPCTHCEAGTCNSTCSTGDCESCDPTSPGDCYVCGGDPCQTCSNGTCVAKCNPLACETCDVWGNCVVCGGDPCKQCVDGSCTCPLALDAGPKPVCVGQTATATATGASDCPITIDMAGGKGTATGIGSVTLNHTVTDTDLGDGFIAFFASSACGTAGGGTIEVRPPVQPPCTIVQTDAEVRHMPQNLAICSILPYSIYIWVDTTVVTRNIIQDCASSVVQTNESPSVSSKRVEYILAVGQNPLSYVEEHTVQNTCDGTSSSNPNTVAGSVTFRDCQGEFDAAENKCISMANGISEKCPGECAADPNPGTCIASCQAGAVLLLGICETKAKNDFTACSDHCGPP